MPNVPLIEDAAQSIGARRSLRWRVEDGRRARDDRYVQLLSVEESRRLRRRRDDRDAGRCDRDAAAPAAHARRRSRRTCTTKWATTAASTRCRRRCSRPSSHTSPSGARARRKHAAYYDRGVRATSPRFARRPSTQANESIYNQYTIRTDRRDALQAHLKAKEIGTAIYYPMPLHLQQCFAYLGYREGASPNPRRRARGAVAAGLSGAHPDAAG